MTEIEVAEKIVESKYCSGVGCPSCPANIMGEWACKCGGACGTRKTESQLQWFKDFLKGAKGMNGIDKAEAKKRLDVIEESTKALEGEARKLREIIEKGDRIEYDKNKMYVAINNSGMYKGASYLLVGQRESKYFRWHAFSELKTETGWSSNHGTGQAAIDFVISGGFDIHVFTDTRKAFEFFLEHYKG